jgi:hypothetical protein
MLHPSPHNRLHSSVTESWKLPPDPEAGRIMPIAHFPGGPLLTSIERPRCLRCASRMMLSRISPRPIGFEHRRFECLSVSTLRTRSLRTILWNRLPWAGLPENLGHRTEEDVHTCR